MSLKPLIAGQFYTSGGGGGGDMTKAVYDPANIASQVAGTTVSNTFLAAQLVSLSSLGTTPTACLTLVNPTAAAAGAQQVSPSLVWEGQGWKTDATAASQAVAYRAHVEPVQGSSAPSGEWHLEASINGGAYSTLISVYSNGSLSTGGVGSAGAGYIQSGADSAIYAFGLLTRNDGEVAWSSTNGFTGTKDLFLLRNAAATLQLGRNAAGVTNQMITAANRITSDGVGANLTIAPGNGRGGAGGSLILSTYTTGGAGVAGTLTPRLYVNGPNGLLQFGGQTNSFSALKGNGDQVQCRLADDSDWAPFLALNYTANGSAGVSAGPFTTIDSITVVGGIITDLQGS